MVVFVRRLGLGAVASPFGFLLIDKPRGLVSFDVVRRLRKILKVRRIGYAGTLDPLASGLMLVAVGEATKILHALEGAPKVYEVKIRFGSISETYDAEGPLQVFENASEPSLATIKKVLRENFNGECEQIPPRYSAVKIAGKHAYDLVRKGRDVKMPQKKVHFFDVKVGAFRYPFLECTVHCSAGTYIRSFAHDLGQKLQCGAYVEELRRTKIGELLIEDAVALEKITVENWRDFLMLPEDFLKDWPQCELTTEEHKSLTLGAFVKNRWKIIDDHVLALCEGRTVGLLEPCKDPGLVKFAKRFVFD